MIIVPSKRDPSLPQTCVVVIASDQTEKLCEKKGGGRGREKNTSFFFSFRLCTTGKSRKEGSGRRNGISFFTLLLLPNFERGEGEGEEEEVTVFESTLSDIRKTEGGKKKVFFPLELMEII